ncbi:MAG: sigma 54-interacting transcriptional regulator [Peptococcaceae bacterium]|jgi:PAS domain S-box-containing protein|nr:sigma 54-interacting transcriptional regulator [Peptococcaceae bacterium]MDH7526285.1 sigma 54-interacting transcriptional regulator [Peptococcaceae bacterium]
MLKDEGFDAVSFLEDFINRLASRNFQELTMEDTKENLARVLTEFKQYKENDFDFREIGNHLYDGLYISDGTGKTLYINKAYTRITGIRPDQIIGRNVKEIEEEGKLYKNAVTMEVIKHKKRVNSVGISLVNGQKMLITGSPIFDEHGNVKKVVISNREMTDLLEMRAELEASQEKLKAVEEDERKSRQEIEHLRKLQLGKGSIIGKSQEIENVTRLIKQVAGVDVTVLITGETGVGKEVVANEIYASSSRKNGAFIKVNCAAIPANLLEAELFGYEKGAFTGANAAGKAGLFELAHKGTILLDEIGDLPLDLQSKLLRIIQHKEVTRIGGTTPIELDVRIISATNRDLRELVKAGKFREDLYYRLNVFPIHISPLRSRPEDIEPLAIHFVNVFNKKYGKALYISRTGIEILRSYNWPGNVRELQNVIERMVVISEMEGPIDEEKLANILDSDSNGLSDYLLKEAGLKGLVENTERKIIEKVLSQYGSTREAAKILKIDQSTIVKKAKKLGIKTTR